MAGPGGSDLATITADYNTNLLPYPTLEGRIWDAAGLLELEDRAGVVPECTMRPDNEGVARAIKGHRRLVGAAIINPLFGEESVREFERCVTEFGFRGLKFQPTFHAFPIHGTAADPLMRRARD